VQRGADLLLVSGGGGWFGRGPAAAAVDSEGEWQQGPIQGPGKGEEADAWRKARDWSGGAAAAREMRERATGRAARESGGAAAAKKRAQRG